MVSFASARLYIVKVGYMKDILGKKKKALLRMKTFSFRDWGELCTEWEGKFNEWAKATGLLFHKVIYTQELKPLFLNHANADSGIAIAIAANSAAIGPKGGKGSPLRGSSEVSIPEDLTSGTQDHAVSSHESPLHPTYLWVDWMPSELLVTLNYLPLIYGNFYPQYCSLIVYCSGLYYQL